MMIIILVKIMHSFEWHWKTMANFEFIIMRLHDSVKCISSKFKCLAGKCVGEEKLAGSKINLMLLLLLLLLL